MFSGEVSCLVVSKYSITVGLNLGKKSYFDFLNRLHFKRLRCSENKIFHNTQN